MTSAKPKVPFYLRLEPALRDALQIESQRRNVPITKIVTDAVESFLRKENDATVSQP